MKSLTWEFRKDEVSVGVPLKAQYPLFHTFGDNPYDGVYRRDGNVHGKINRVHKVRDSFSRNVHYSTELVICGCWSSSGW